MQFTWFFTKDRLEFKQMTACFFSNNESRYVQVYSLLLDDEKTPCSSLVLLEDGVCVGFAFYDGKKNLYLSDIPLEAIPSLTKHSSIKDWEYTRLGASKRVAEVFLSQQQGVTLDMNQFVFSCSQVQLPPSQGGVLVQAELDNFDTAYQMFEGFFVECWPDSPIPEHLRVMLKKEIEKNNVFLWKNSDGEFVSMAAKVRTTTNTASISWVYTFRKSRGYGYGAKATAYLTERLLKQGYQECNLFTDASNPISNHIYTKIGYVQIGEQSVYSLVR